MQNMVWGISQPFVGALADRFGSGRVIVGGAVVYILGLTGMALSESVLMFSVNSGLFVGLGAQRDGFRRWSWAPSRAPFRPSGAAS